MKYIAIIIFFLCASMNTMHTTSYVPEKGFVPDDSTAIRIAEAIWIPIYGEANIKRQKPFKVTLRDSTVWVVKGTLHQPTDGSIRRGGVAHIEIQKSDCKIINVYHTR